MYRILSASDCSGWLFPASIVSSEVPAGGAEALNRFKIPDVISPYANNYPHRPLPKPHAQDSPRSTNCPDLCE